jgi:hypothetical protein
MHEGSADATTPWYPRPGRAQRRVVVADAAALLHRQRPLVQRAKDAVERVFDGAHHEAIEERDATPGAGAGKNAPPGKKPEIRQCVGETAFPRSLRVRLRRGQLARDPCPGRVDRGLRGAIRGHGDTGAQISRARRSAKAVIAKTSAEPAFRADNGNNSGRSMGRRSRSGAASGAVARIVAKLRRVSS